MNIETPNLSTVAQKQIYNNKNKDQKISAIQFLQSGQVDSARDIAESLLESNPYDVDAIEILAQCFEVNNDVTNALQCYTSLVVIDGSYKNLSLLADAYYREALYEMSLKTYTRILESSQITVDQRFEALRKLGNMYVILGSYVEAEKYYFVAQEINPESDVLLVNLGTLEFQRDQLNKSVTYFRKAIEVNIKNDKAWVGLALIHREYGDSELAISNVMKAIDVNPKNITATQLLLEICLGSGEPSRALNFMNHIYKLYPMEDFHFAICQLYQYSGHAQKSWIEINNHLKKYPRSLVAQDFRESLRINRETVI